MLPSNSGTFRLFRFAGIDVYLHWWWFLLAAYELQERDGRSLVWRGAELLSVFAIVLLHEFGHSLACRSVGGRADRIVLWPLGGIAYVDPPQRPGATLWSIAAGPLVNVALMPVFFVAVLLLRNTGVEAAWPAVAAFVGSLVFINKVILYFNLLPIYPLDGGQILRSLLWFVLGRSTSLTVTSVLGFLGVGGLLLLAYLTEYAWFIVIAAFAGYSCWQGFRHSRRLAAFAKLPRHVGYACPSCGAAPPIGLFWGCGQCHTKFDTFETHATCPNCSVRFTHTVCFDCGRDAPIDVWVRSVA